MGESYTDVALLFTEARSDIRYVMLIGLISVDLGDIEIIDYGAGLNRC
jgi:hypothetical protein